MQTVKVFPLRNVGRNEPLAGLLVSGINSTKGRATAVTAIETRLVTDEQLTYLLRAGHRDALAPLVERHHARLVGYLYHLSGGDRALAEDWAQEAFIRLLRGIDHYDQERTFKTYLYAIATNLARDYYKSASFRLRALPLEQVEQMAAQMDSPEQQVEQQLMEDMEARQVVMALSELPSQQRETVILRYYEEWSLAEIAAALTIPVGTVKSRLSLGLKRLRELLEVEVQDAR